MKHIAYILLLSVYFSLSIAQSSELGIMQSLNKNVSLNDLRYSFSGLMLVDKLQTEEIVRNDKFIEINPILGENPSTLKQNLYFGGVLIIVNTISYYLPKDAAKFLLVGANLIQISQTSANINIGVKF